MLNEMECNDEGINFEEFSKIFRAEQKEEEKKFRPDTSTHVGPFASSSSMDHSSMEVSQSEDEP